jgi:Tfp pilus assembly protein PilF
MAANNLAFLMLKTGGNVDVAMSLAETARRGLPNSPNVADTLGWILCQKGAYRSAIDLFQEALRLGQQNGNRDNPTVHYHLGMAYAKSDQPRLARQQLERVLKIDPNYSDAADVKKQLAGLS